MLIFKYAIHHDLNPGFHILELVRTNAFLRFFVDGKLMLYDWSVFYYDHLSIIAEGQIGNLVILRDFELLDIPPDAKVSSQDEYKLPQRKDKN